MDINVSGKGLDLGEALQHYVAQKMETGVHKYFDRPAEAQVVFAKEGSRLRCETTAHLASGVFLAATGEAGDAYGAFDASLEKLEKRVRRYKRRLKNHHNDTKPPLPAEIASSYVLEPIEAEPENDTGDIDALSSPGEDPAPVIIAENTTKLRYMTVGAAVLQLELADEPVVIFNNAANGAINIVFRRPDGNIGWVDSYTKK